MDIWTALGIIYYLIGIWVSHRVFQREPNLTFTEAFWLGILVTLLWPLTMRYFHEENDN